MPAIHSLVPARFLTLTAHLVIVITIFWSRDNNVRACLPLDFSQDEYRSQDTQLVVALSVTLGLFAIELAGFFSGVSMFNSTQSLLSIAAHASASVALLFFLFEQWSCAIYWWIFGFCSTGCPLQRLRVPVFLRLSAMGVLDILVCVHLLQCSPCINGNPPLRFCLRPEKEAAVRSLDRALVILSLTSLALRSHRETRAHKGPQESAGSLTMGYRIKVKYRPYSSIHKNLVSATKLVTQLCIRISSIGSFMCHSSCTPFLTHFWSSFFLLFFNILCVSGMVVQWIALSPCSEKVLGSIPGSPRVPFCVEFACSSCACVGFLPQSKNMQIRSTGYS